MQPTNDTLTSAATRPSRRRLLLATACVTTAPTLTACSSSDTVQPAARALREPGAPFSDKATPPLLDLVRQATLAPSSHNTHCWRFQIVEKSIVIAPDLARRCPVVDPDDHHLFVSLGCATENLAQAALAAGLHAEPRFDPGGDGAIAVSLKATQARITPPSQAVAERQCTRGDCDGQPTSPAELRQIRSSAGIAVLITERSDEAA